jgi:hypothetical protein
MVHGLNLKTSKDINGRPDLSGRPFYMKMGIGKNLDTMPRLTLYGSMVFCTGRNRLYLG